MQKINQISPQEHEFTSQLTNIAKVPKSLWYMGELPSRDLPAVAIVGTRKPSAYGREVTTRLASALARRGVIIISGLAIGVDGAAHTAALEAGGRTLAVLGNGLPEIYPASHRGLAARLLEQNGAIISEYEPHSRARPYQFLERNRLVSGLADAVIITEAAARSGTLNTAAHALEQGKDVFVVPGNITSPLSAGCNNLIAQGAQPITSIDDFVDEFLGSEQTALNLPSVNLAGNEKIIFDLIASGVRDGEELLSASKLAASDYSLAITMLEIDGLIKSAGSNIWAPK